MFSLLHHRLSDANQSDSSGEEQELQVQLLPADGVSSKESIRTAVSERGHRLVCIYYNINNNKYVLYICSTYSMDQYNME